MASSGGGPLTRAVVEDIVREVVTARFGGGRPGGLNPLVVHPSARHMHVSREDLDVLFGPGYTLTSDRPLYQEGNFAAKETVTLIGRRNRIIPNLRILGPLRKQSQIELAFTDAISLGLDDVPVRLSGDIAGTPGAYVVGPAGMVHLREGVIRAAIHVHMNPAEARHYGVKQGDVMRLRVGGDAGVVFSRVHVRVDDNLRLNVHMDTDEANACALHLARDFELISEKGGGQ
ncbi:MAG: phosphate propanoyltransferase [Vicinamibacterales bacterium]|nr:phosphate propanoyltransferase [Vicinamibacterales bacterium]